MATSLAAMVPPVGLLGAFEHYPLCGDDRRRHVPGCLGGPEDRHWDCAGFVAAHVRGAVAGHRDLGPLT